MDSIMGRNINDGYFEVDYLEDGVYLVVRKPVGKGKMVDESEVLDTIRKKQIKSFDAKVISYVVKTASGVAEKIAPPQTPEKINATVAISVSEDKMRAFMTIYPPIGGKDLSIQELIQALKQSGVIFGVKKDVLQSMAEYPVYNESVCIAEGISAQNGKNGTIQFFVDVNKDRKPTILEDGSVNYRELDYIENVSKDQKLCQLMPPESGKPGKTVAGIDIQALDGKPATIKRGRNVYLSQDETELYSNLDGQIQYLDGKVSVFSSFEVPADVDNSTGNINFIGNVTVRGNVLSGFTIEAGGNVEVHGVVEGAVIKAEGDIILRRGMNGVGKGTLIAGGDIVSKYIENSIVIARGSIKAEAVMHSDIKCGTILELGGKKGLLVGGNVKVGKEVSAKVIGSPMATVTNLEVGVDPTLRDRYKQLRDELKVMEPSVKKSMQAIEILRKFETAGVLTDDKKELLAKSIRSKAFYESKIAEHKVEIQQIEEKLKSVSEGKIRAAMTIFPGVKASIGSASLYVKENLSRCTLYNDGADVRVGAL